MSKTENLAKSDPMRRVRDAGEREVGGQSAKRLGNDDA